MQNVKTLETVERAIFLNKVACFDIALNFQRILNRINLKNKDPCYGFKLLYLRI